MEWLGENWIWVLLIIGVLAMHLFGHGGFGHGHGQHRRRRWRRRDDGGESRQGGAPDPGASVRPAPAVHDHGGGTLAQPGRAVPADGDGNVRSLPEVPGARRRGRRGC